MTTQVTPAARPTGGPARRSSGTPNRAWRDTVAALARARIFIVAALMIVLVLGPTYTNLAWLSVWTSISILALAGVALNLVFGYAGILDSGHAIYFGLGAYTTILATSHLEKPSIVGIGLSMALGAVVAGLLGMIVLRMQGFFQLLITVALASIAGALIVSFSFTGAEVGVSAGTRDLLGTGNLDDVQLHVLVAGTVAVFVVLVELLPATRLGRLLATVRTVPDVAATAGVNVFRTRLIVYMTGGAISALAGGFSAMSLLFASPSSIGLEQSIQILMVVVIGGATTSLGPVLGATLLLILPQWFSGITDYQTLLIGVVFILVLVQFRGGLARVLPERREAPQQASAGAPESAALQDSLGSLENQTAATLEIVGLHKQFGGLKAVDGVDLTVEPGQVHALVGPNGSGKSTIVNLTTGLLTPTSGEVRFGGATVHRMPTFRRSRLGMTRTFQLVALTPSLSLRENVMVGALAARRTGLFRGALIGPRSRWERPFRERADRVMRAVGISQFAHLRPDEAPPGIRRLTEVARCLVSGAGLLILDEPAAGLDSTEKQHLVTVLRQVVATGRSILLVEHDMALVMSLADRITVVDQGRMLAQGEPDLVRNDPAVAAAYFGRRAVGPAAPAGHTAQPADDETNGGAA